MVHYMRDIILYLFVCLFWAALSSKKYYAHINLKYLVVYICIIFYSVYPIVYVAMIWIVHSIAELHYIVCANVNKFVVNAVR